MSRGIVSAPVIRNCSPILPKLRPWGLLGTPPLIITIQSLLQTVESENDSFLKDFCLLWFVSFSSVTIFQFKKHGKKSERSHCQGWSTAKATPLCLARASRLSPPLHLVWRSPSRVYERRLAIGHGQRRKWKIVFFFSPRRRWFCVCLSSSGYHFCPWTRPSRDWLTVEEKLSDLLNCQAERRIEMREEEVDAATRPPVTVQGLTNWAGENETLQSYGGPHLWWEVKVITLDDCKRGVITIYELIRYELLLCFVKSVHPSSISLWWLYNKIYNHLLYRMYDVDSQSFDLPKTRMRLSMLSLSHFWAPWETTFSCLWN